MPRLIYRKYYQDYRTASYQGMENEGLLEIARELCDDETTRGILGRVGIHGDLMESEEQQIDTFVIEGVERRGWEGPDPANLYIPIALARQYAAGGLDPADTPAALDFLDDRRCDAVVLGRPSTNRPNRLSELLPIMHALEEREDLKAPFEKVRHKILRRGQSYFDDEEQGRMFWGNAEYFVNQQRFKYALLNRSHYGFNQVVSLLGLYAARRIDRLDDDRAIDHVLSGNRSHNKQIHIIDDRPENE